MNSLEPVQIYNKNKTLSFLRSEGSFTLIELILVIVVIGIIIAITVPNFRGSYEFLRFENSVQNFIKLIRYGQDMAILHSKPYRICIDAKKNAFWLERNKEGSDKFEKMSGKLGRRFVLPEKVEIKPDKKCYEFFVDGKSQSGKVIFKLKGKYTYTVMLNGSRGNVEIVEKKEERRR